MAKDWKEIGDQLEQVGNSTSKFLDRYNEISARSNLRESSVLFGTTGGIIGSLIGIFLAPVVGIQLLLLTVPTTGLGITLGLLGYRGSSTFKLERRLAHKKMISRGILEEIKALPDGAPKTVEQSLWLKYENSISEIDEPEALKLPPPKRKTEQLALPNKPDDNNT